MKIEIRDSQTLLDSINILKKKIMDFDLTKPGVKSIAAEFLKRKDKINETTSFVELKPIFDEVIAMFDTPKSKEMWIEGDKLDRIFKRNPKQGGHNDLFCWEKLLKYIYSIMLKAQDLGSPDVKSEDSKPVEDADDEVLHVARLLGEAHDKIIEAMDLVESLEEEETIGSELRYALEDVEAPLSELDFMGESDPKFALLNAFRPEEIESWEIDEEDW